MQKTLLQLRIWLKLTYVLLLFNLFMFVFSILWSSTFNGFGNSLYWLGGLNLPAVINGEVTRLVAAAFLHGSMLHLAVNMVALYDIGGLIERFYGAKKLLLIYVFGAIGASMFSLIATFVGTLSSGNIDDSLTLGVGASGAIFALVGVILGSKYKTDTYSAGIANYVNTGYLTGFVVFNLLLGFGANSASSSINIDNWAHIGGLVTGMAMGMFLEPVNSYYHSTLKHKFEYVLEASAIVLLAFSLIGQAFIFMRAVV